MVGRSMTPRTVLLGAAMLSLGACTPTTPKIDKSLERDLEQLKAALPEHCYGTDGYIDVHRASPEHWQKIEDLEEQIQHVKAEMEG